jgi:hypothetical protein
VGVGGSSLHKVDTSKLPTQYPTHCLPSEFWEQLGRVVASFSFLEDILLRAIVALTFTRELAPDELEAEAEKCSNRLLKVVSDPLGPLIDEYFRLAKRHQAFPISNIEDFEAKLRTAATYRNVMCHGKWRAPDEDGTTVPHFVNKRGEKWNTAVTHDFLVELQAHTSELITEVVNSITLMGWAFPGTHGPGKPLVD